MWTIQRKNTIKSKETGGSRYIYQDKPHKACSKHDMTYGDFKNLPRRTSFDKVLRDQALNIAKKKKKKWSCFYSIEVYL